MVRISDLPIDLLVKILSFAPTKVAVSTSILSKQWEFLWMWLPKLEYRSRKYPKSAALVEFIDKNLPLHPVIESLRLDLLSSHIEPENIKRWVEISVSRKVRELEVSYDSESEKIFPGSFYTCAWLVILKLGYTHMDVPSTGCLSSLKTLNLECLKYANQESLQRLLSICPVLEELSVNLGDAGDDIDNMREFTVIVPSLLSLSLLLPNDWHLDGYVIDAPSLKYFKLEDWNDGEHYSEIKNMPNLREASVDLLSHDLKSLIGSITSVKRLTICSDDVSGDGFVLNQLEHLKLCACKNDSSNLLARLLKDSPNLRVLDISVIEGHATDAFDDYMGCWNQPSPVPECLLSSLQILNWSRYFGRPQERDIAVYILRNACRLKTATFLADTWEYDVSNLKMIKELTLSSRASSTCQLVFVEDDRQAESESE